MGRKNKATDPVIVESPKPKISVKKSVKPVTAANMAKDKPEWWKLYLILSDSGDAILQSLRKREDIPEDAQELLKAVLLLRELRTMCFCEGESLSPASALFWAQELSDWVLKTSPMVEVDVPLGETSDV